MLVNDYDFKVCVCWKGVFRVVVVCVCVVCFDCILWCGVGGCVVGVICCGKGEIGIFFDNYCWCVFGV